MSQFSTGKKNVNLQQVSGDQRKLIMCALTQFTMLAVHVALGDRAMVSFTTSLMYLLVTIVAVVYVFRVATTLFGSGAAFGLALLTTIPFVSLIVLLAVNSKAINLQRQGGVEATAFLGASASGTPFATVA
jgi:hypothetical protein